MKRYWIDIGCQARPQTEDLESHFLDVMDALLDEPGVVDPDVTAELATGHIMISMAVDAASDREALDKVLVATRSAIHKAGGFTPDWGEPRGDEFFVTDGFDARVRPAELASR